MDRIYKSIIGESYDEKRVKEAFRSIEHVYGHDLVMEIASKKTGLKDAFSKLSGTFDDIDCYEIYAAIIKGALLSSSNHPFFLYARNKVANRQILGLMMDMESNISLKQAWVENFLFSLECNYSNMDLFYRIDHKDRTINVADTIASLENFMADVRMQRLSPSQRKTVFSHQLSKKREPVLASVSRKKGI